MPLSRTEIDAIVTRMQGTRDLSPGGISALKEVLYALNDEIVALQSTVTSIRAANVVLGTYNATAFPSGLEAAGAGAVTVTIDSPAPGFIEFNA